MKNFLNKFKYVLIGAAVMAAGTVAALNITVPSAPGTGYTLVSTTTGAYIATTTSPFHIGSLYINGKSDGCATWASGLLNSTGIACGSGSGSSFPFPLVGNGTSTLTSFYGGLNASTISATSTATSTIANFNTELWVPTDFATRGCAGNPTYTDFGKCVNGLYSLASTSGNYGVVIKVPVIKVTAAQWTTPINFNINGLTPSLQCDRGATLIWGGGPYSTSTTWNFGNPTGHIVSDDYGCLYQGNTALIAAGNNNTKLTGGHYFGGNFGAVGVNFHDNTVNGFGINTAVGKNAYMLTLQNNSISGGNGTTSNSHWGSLLNIDAASNSGEKNQIIGNNFTDPGNLVATSAINIQRGATASNMFTNNTYDNVGMFIGSSNGMVSINGGHGENAGCNYPGYIPFLGESSDQSTHIVISGFELANDCTGTFSFSTVIKHGGSLTVLGFHIDNYTGGTINTFSDHSLDNGLETELICGVQVQGGTLTNIIGGNGNQAYSSGAGANCFSTVNNSYPVGIIADGSNTAVIRNGGQDVATFSDTGNWTFGTAASNSIITMRNQLVVGASNLGKITVSTTTDGCVQSTAGVQWNTGTACGSGGGSGTVGSGVLGQFPYYAANGTTLTATSSLFILANGNVGIGTTTPPSPLTLSTTPLKLVSTNPIFLIGTSTLSAANANGTYFGINAPINYGGDFLVFQKNGSQMFKVEGNGKVTTAGDMSVEVGNFFSNNILSSSNGQGTIGTPSSFFSTIYVNKASTTLLSVAVGGLATTTISTATSTFAGSIQVPPGSVSVPSIVFTGGTGTGISGDATSLRFSTAGIQRAFFTNTAFQTADLDIINPTGGLNSYQIQHQVRSLTNPTYSFFTDQNTGYGSYADDVATIVAGGAVNSLYGVGSTTIAGNLTVAGPATSTIVATATNIQGRILRIGSGIATINYWPTGGGQPSYFNIDRSDSSQDGSILWTTAGVPNWEMGMPGFGDFFIKSITGTGGAAAFTNRMWISSTTGAIGFGTQVPAGFMELSSSSPSTQFTITNTVGAGSNRSALVLNASVANKQFYLATDAGQNGSQNAFLNWGGFGTGLFFDASANVGVNTTSLATGAALTVSGTTSTSHLQLTALRTSILGNSVCMVGTEVVTAGAATCATSSIFTKDITGELTFEESKNIIEKMRAISFNYKEGGTEQVGFIAEEVEKIDPRLVDHAKEDITLDGHLFKKGDPISVNYGNYTAVITKYLQGLTLPQSSKSFDWKTYGLVGLFGLLAGYIIYNEISKRK